jgi:hypothetical protein
MFWVHLWDAICPCSGSTCGVLVFLSVLYGLGLLELLLVLSLELSINLGLGTVFMMSFTCVLADVYYVTIILSFCPYQGLVYWIAVCLRMYLMCVFIIYISIGMGRLSTGFFVCSMTLGGYSPRRLLLLMILLSIFSPLSSIRDGTYMRTIIYLEAGP